MIEHARTSYVPLGPPGPGGAQPVRYERTEAVLIDGQLMEMKIEGTAEVIRGPLGRIIDLIDQIEAEGLAVPARIKEAVQAEQETP